MPLTAGVDAPSNTAGNDTYSATGATLGAQDSIDGGAGADKLVITDTTKASEAGLAAATIKNVEALELSTNGGVGAFATSSNATGGAKQVVTVTTTGATITTGPTAASVTINGQTYTDSTVSGSTLEGVNDNIKALILAALGNSVTITDASATDGLFTITALAEGQVIPAITISTTNTTGEDYATVAETTTPGAEIASSTGAVGGLQTITLAAVGNSQTTADTYSVNFNGNTIAVYTGTTLSSAATAIAAQVNALAGSTIATAVNNTVTIQGTAGQPLPLIGVTIADGGTDTASPTATVANLRSSADGATTATSAVVYDASGFGDAFTANGAGDMNVKAAAKADVTLTNTTGKIEVAGGDNVAITTTGTGTTTVKSKDLATVSVKGGGNVTVNNLGGTAGTTDNTGTTLTAVTLDGITGSSATAAIGSDSVTTLNLKNQKHASNTLGVTVTNTKSTSLDVNLDAVGYTTAGAAGGAVTVNAGAAAKTINLAAATKSKVTLGAATVAETLNISGAGAVDATVSSLAVKTISSTNTAGATLGTLNAATKAVTTGAGDDEFTVAATTKDVAVSTGEGKDTVTIGQLVAGATVSLGAGDDKVLGSAVVAAKTTADPGMIDGGEGNDVVSSLLLNSGNASRFTNFEVLGLATASATFDASLVSVTGLELLVANSGVYTGVTKSQGLAVNGNIGSGSTTLTFGASDVAGTADSYTVTFGAKGATTSTADSRTSIDAGTLVIEGIENAVIVSNQASGYVNNTIDLTGAKLKTVTISGNAAETTLGFAGTVGTNPTSGAGGAVNTIDASAATGRVVLSTANVTADDSATGLTIKTGAGKDDVTTRHKATIDLGAGDDAITFAVSLGSYNSANSTVTGGAGKDAYNVSALVVNTGDTAADTAAEVLITITDFQAGDTIDFSAGSEDAETALGAAVSTATASNLADAITAIVVGAGTAGNHIAWGVYGGNTYVVHNADKGSGTDTAIESGDVIVKLSGVLDLSAAAFSDTGVLSLA